MLNNINSKGPNFQSTNFMLYNPIFISALLCPGNKLVKCMICIVGFDQDMKVKLSNLAAEKLELFTAQRERFLSVTSIFFSLTHLACIVILIASLSLWALHATVAIVFIVSVKQLQCFVC